MKAAQESTCWTVIEAAAAGDAARRQEFVHRYQPLIRACLAARWRDAPCRADLEDAVQEVFVECFRADGVLDRADRTRSFRAFLRGVVRNVARRFEGQRQKPDRTPGDVPLEAIPDQETELGREFDRAWAQALVREAGRLQETRARQAGQDAWRRVELLRLRFQDGLPIRDVADRWGVEAALLHHEYARARQEFKAALGEVVVFHCPESADR